MLIRKVRYLYEFLVPGKVESIDRSKKKCFELYLGCEVICRVLSALGPNIRMLETEKTKVVMSSGFD